MKQIITNQLDFLELFKVNQLIKGGVERAKHHSLGVIDFDKTFELNGNQKLFLNLIKKRFYNDEYKLLFKNKDIHSDDLIYNSFLFFMWKNMLPHLHSLEMVGTQPSEHMAQMIFCTHYLSPDDDTDIMTGKKAPDGIKKMNFSIDRSVVGPPKNFNKSYKLLTPLMNSNGVKIGFEEIVYNKYPDFLKMFLIDMINTTNENIFKCIFFNIENLENETHIFKDANDLWTMICKLSNKIFKDTYRGNGKNILITEELYNELYSIDLVDKDLSKVDRTFRYLFDKHPLYNFIIDTHVKGKEFLIGYSGYSEMDAGIFYSPIKGEFDIWVDVNNNLKYTIPINTVENTFGGKNYFKRVIFK